MSTILAKILHEKKSEISKLTSIMAELDKRVRKTKSHSFIEKLEHSNNMLVISEFKRASPSKGLINGGADPIEQAQLYEKMGANAISVLTDEKFFKGSFFDLQLISQHVSIPILCKDFMIDKLQIDVAKKAGADIVLLIVAALPYPRLKMLYEYAVANHLEVLVEVHDEREVEQALKLGARIIGVNNRDLKTFHVNISRTEQLAPRITAGGAHLISESGLKNRDDLERVATAGAKAVLIGEALMKSHQPGRLLQQVSEIVPAKP